MAAGIANNTGAQIPTFYVSGLRDQAIWDLFVTNQLVPKLIESRNNKTPAYDIFYQRRKKAGLKGIIQNVRAGRGYAAISAIHHEGNMPDPVHQGGYQYATSCRDIYWRIAVSGALLRAASAGNVMGAIDAVQYEMEGVAQDLAIKQEIMLHGDGSGRRGEAVTAGSTLASGILVVRLPSDNEGVANCTSDTTSFLDVGMRVAFVTAGGTLRGTTAYYVISKTASAITVSASLGGSAANISGISLTTGDWIVDAARDASLSANNLDTGWKQEPMGLEGIFKDTGVLDGIGISTSGQQTYVNNYTLTSDTDQNCGFQGVQVNGAALTAAYPPPDFNKAIVLDAGGGARRAISDTLLQQACSDADRINNARVAWLFSHHSMYDAYVDTLIGDKRFNSTNLQGGHASLTFNDSMGPKEWRKSRFALKNKVWGVDPETISVYENAPPTQVRAPGGPHWQLLDDQDRYWCAYMTSYQIFCDLRQRAGFALVDVQ